MVFPREWVAKILGQLTDSNRAEAQDELKQIIGEAFTKKTLWTTDWNGVHLKRFAGFTSTWFLFL